MTMMMIMNLEENEDVEIETKKGDTLVLRGQNHQ